MTFLSKRNLTNFLLAMSCEKLTRKINTVKEDTNNPVNEKATNPVYLTELFQVCKEPNTLTKQQKAR